MWHCWYLVAHDDGLDLDDEKSMPTASLMRAAPLDAVKAAATAHLRVACPA
jgi:hypothetical protein